MIQSAGGFFWYHEIDLLNGEKTVPCSDYRENWSMTRRTRTGITYAGKRVLDIAAWDGMWSFEAEELGASFVASADVVSVISSRPDIACAINKFLYAREKRGSKAVPYFDRSIHTLTGLIQLTGKFDIIQNLGLLYHLENPWHALKQCRMMIHDNGEMLIETAFDPLAAGAVMRMNRGSSTFYDCDAATYWAPSKECLVELLRACFFEVVESSILELGVRPVDRISLIARAIPIPDGPARVEFDSNYRNGL
jgi:tRNA (mo5U34)-methyltransferase